MIIGMIKGHPTKNRMDVSGDEAVGYQWEVLAVGFAASRDRERGPQRSSPSTSRQSRRLPNPRAAPQEPPPRSRRRWRQSQRRPRGLGRPGRSWPPGTPHQGGGPAMALVEAAQPRPCSASAPPLDRGSILPDALHVQLGSQPAKRTPNAADPHSWAGWAARKRARSLPCASQCWRLSLAGSASVQAGPAWWAARR
jgi:hypothetical protein